MNHNNYAILTDFNGKPVPQYWNSEKGRYEVVEGSHNLLSAYLVDDSGHGVLVGKYMDGINKQLGDLVEISEVISPKKILSRIELKLDELIEVVE